MRGGGLIELIETMFTEDINRLKRRRKMRNLIERIEKRSSSQGFTQECAVAFAEGWFETLTDLNAEKSYNVNEILELLVCLNGIRKCS